MAKNKLFLLDAMALLYRAHFAFIKNPRKTSKGLDTSAVFGFTNTLLDILNREDPSHFAVAFDPQGPTFRHVQYEEYKGHREEMPEDLRIAIPYVYRMLKVMDIPALVLDGYEADDVIGTLAHTVSEAEFDVYMVTPDKDYAQLVRDNVFLYRPLIKGGGYDVLGAKEVIEKYGVRPDQIIDYLGLTGDASDNIPGIPKIGEKTAIALLNEYGSMDKIFESLDSISKKALKETLTENKEQGLLSRELATIHTRVPIAWELSQLKMGHCDLPALIELMGELEFRTLAERILSSKLNPLKTGVQSDLFGNTIGVSADAIPVTGQASGLVGTVSTIDHDYKLLQSTADRKNLVQRIQKAGYFCFDTETTSLNELEAELVGLSLSFKEGEAYFQHFPENREEVLIILDDFLPLFQDPKVLKIGQNLKYDLLVLKNYDITVADPMFDTMLAHYVLKPDGKHGMDAMAREILQYEPVSIETLIGGKGKNQKSMRDVPLEQLLEYAAEDADVTFRLYQKLSPEVRGNYVFEAIEQPLMPVLRDMEYEGVKIDVKALQEYSVELDRRMGILEQEIYQLAGEKFNINSPKQLGEILFEKLNLGSGKKAKKTKTGQYATDEQILQDLAVKHELPARILAYRGNAKLKSTYVDALPRMINARTGRVHTTYSQSVAVTGRLSSINPNLQNIPIRTDDGQEVRRGFIARNEDYLILSADYSQVELRIMAALSEDPNMITAFREGMDIHRATAARVFGIAPEQVTSLQRSQAKQVNFGIIYGISAFGLSQRIGISRTEAKEIIDAYFATYPRVKAYMDECIQGAREKGYVETYFGRRRYLPDVLSNNATVRGFAERNAINSPIQGTAADIIKLAMIELHQAIRTAGYKSRMIMQVHDELVFDVHKDELDEVKTLVHDKMVHAVNLIVPMEAEVGVGKNWLEAH